MSDSGSEGYYAEKRMEYKELLERKLIGKFAVCDHNIPALVTDIHSLKFIGVSFYTGGKWESKNPKEISFKKLRKMLEDRDKARRKWSFK